MTVELLNFGWFFFILLFAGLTVGLYFLLRKRSWRARYWTLFGILMFGFVLHFLKLTFPPYTDSLEKGISSIFMVNICAVSVVLFPFIFLTKSNFLKDGMIYLGLLSGFLALFYPTEAIGKEFWTLDLWRFYIHHGILFMVPCLMLLLKVHKLDYRRVPLVPLYMIGVLCLIIVNQVIASELGFIGLRHDNFLAVPWHNPSLFWGPSDELAAVFTWLTPDFMKTVPGNASGYAGQPKLWPLFYMLPGILVYFWVLPFAISMIWEYKHFKADIITLFGKIKNLRNAKK